MLRSFLALLTLLLLPATLSAQGSTASTASTAAAAAVSTASSDGYTGYNLSINSPDPGDVTYQTDNTPDNSTNVTTYTQPDIHLNASVHIGEIDIEVSNITAKINLDAQVLSLLKFNAGVDLSIDRVALLIQNVTAKVVLEARLENLVLMIGDILDSLDLNPVLVTLGQDLDNITSTAVGVLETPNQALQKKSLSYDLAHNILYSTNDYSGHTHQNRILAQNGNIIDEYLDNDAKVYKTNVVGYYSRDMSFNGQNTTVMRGGMEVSRLEYVYNPFVGLNVVSWVYVNGTGNVMGTQVVSEGFGGGTSTID